MSQYLYPTILYFNDLKTLVDFWLPENTITLVVLISKLDNLLPNTDNRNVVKIEFRAPSIDIEGKVKYNNFDLKTDEDLKVRWRTYRYRLTKGPIEFDATIVKFVDDIIKILTCPESSSNF